MIDFENVYDKVQMSPYKIELGKFGPDLLNCRPNWAINLTSIRQSTFKLKLTRTSLILTRKFYTNLI